MRTTSSRCWRIRCPPSRSTWTRPPTPTCAASSTRAGCPRRTRCASRSWSTTSTTTTRRPQADAPFSVDVEIADCPWNRSTGWCASACKGQRDRPRRARRQQPGLPARRLRLDAAAEQAAAAQVGAVRCWSSNSTAATGWPSWSTPARRAWCCPRPPAPTRARSSTRSTGSRPAAAPTAARASSWPTRSPGRTSSPAASTASSWPPTATSTSASPSKGRAAAA